VNELLGVFLGSSDEPNARGELDGAAWRFVLPGEVDTVEWRATDDGSGRDLLALERHATVIRSSGDPDPAGKNHPVAELVVGAARASDSATPVQVGIDLEGADCGHLLELRYVNDELRGVVPAADLVARSVLAGHVGAEGPVPRSWKQRLKREPVGVRRTVTGSLRGVPAGPPEWLVVAAAKVGIDISGFGWALWCRGEFGSQKLVMFLIAPGDTRPSIVVKITRDPRFNDRLVNESNMLRNIEQLGPRAKGGSPVLLFHTTTWGSAASAQSAVTGSDLRGHLRRRPELIGQVTTWMIDMADATRTPLRDGELRQCFDDLLDRYCGLYAVPPKTERFLREQVDLLDGCEFDAVMQHGDAGPWNAVLTPDHGIAFLDWEAGESRGLPLWDLLYFLRSASLILSPRRPWQSRRTRTRRDLVDGSEIGVLVADHVRSYVHATRLDPRAVEPLFHLCWAHRAVKEARRLPPDRRSRGMFHRFVLDGVEGRDRPGLRRITMSSDAGGARHGRL
jgi:hypothetical protein